MLSKPRTQWQIHYKEKQWKTVKTTTRVNFPFEFNHIPRLLENTVRFISHCYSNRSRTAPEPPQRQAGEQLPRQVLISQVNAVKFA